MQKKLPIIGSSLVVQWLGFWAFIAVARVQSLVGELRFHKPCGTAKKKNYPLFYHAEIGTDTVCLHVSSFTVLSMHMCTHINKQRHKTGRRKIRIVMIILFYNLHIFSLSIK